MERKGKADLGEEDGADGRVVLESVEDAHPLDLRSPSMDERLPKFDRVSLFTPGLSISIQA